MKVTIDIDVSPAEARAFMGLPDVTVMNERLMDEMQSRMKANMDRLQPEELMKSWMQFGGQAHDQFMALMQAAARGSAQRG